MFSTIPSVHQVVQRSFSRDDGLLSQSCSPLSSSNTTSLRDISLSNLSSTIAHNTIGSLIRTGASIYDFLQSKGDSEMNSQDPSQMFGYEFHESYPEPSAHNPPLLNLEENSYLQGFWQSTQQQSNQTGFTDLRQLENSNPSNGPNGSNGLSAFDWVINEPPPIVQDINVASLPQTPTPQHMHGNPVVSDSETMRLNQNHQNHNSMRQGQRGSGMSPPLSVQRLQSHPPQSQHLYLSPALQHMNGMLSRTPISSAARRIQAIHTHDALVGITAPETMQSMIESADAHMLSALPAFSSASMPTISHTISASTLAASDMHEQPPSNPRLYQFGSDDSFANTGFRPSSVFESHDVKEEALTSELRRLKPINRTPIATREPTPEPVSDHKKERPVCDGNVFIKNENTGTGNKRKRNIELDQSESEDGEKSELNGERSGDNKRRRRSSAPGTNRPKRENLTDQQKRQNHIASEQKRRAQIKLGFDELNRLVPELRDSGLSKSGVLIEACNFLEQLEQRNAALSQRLGLAYDTKSSTH